MNFVILVLKIKLTRLFMKEVLKRTCKQDEYNNNTLKSLIKINYQQLLIKLLKDMIV